MRDYFSETATVCFWKSYFTITVKQNKDTQAAENKTDWYQLGMNVVKLLMFIVRTCFISFRKLFLIVSLAINCKGRSKILANSFWR